MELNRIGDPAKVVVVGAASGMGSAIVHRLVQSGAQVVGLDLATATWPKDSKVCARFIVNVASNESVAHAFDEAFRALEGLDSVVNCAGILGPVKPLTDTTAAEIDSLLAVNLQGAFSITRQALKHLLPQRSGRIVHIASVAGKDGNPGMAGYSASKAGVIGMVKAVAKETARMGVTVNAIAPASIDTPMIQEMSEDRREAQRSLIPMGRFGTVVEAAALVHYILSEDASFTTGFVYDLSGGRATY